MVPVLPVGIKRGSYEWSGINHPRKERWTALNRRLRNWRDHTHFEPDAGGTLLWEIFFMQTTSHVFDQFAIPESRLDSLRDHIATILRFYPSWNNTSGSERAFTILPILYAVCEELSDVRISLARSVEGNLVEASRRDSRTRIDGI